MGGLGPGIGGFEYLIIALVALLVVGPERLPLMLRKLGQWVGKARRMANEFRSSFDEMARQSELDELRKEVEALRRGSSGMMPLGPEAEATFRGIRDDLNRPLDAPAPAPALSGPEEWPESAPVMEPLPETRATEPAVEAAPATKARRTVARKTVKAAEAGAPVEKAPRKPRAAKGAGAPAAPKRRASTRKATGS